MSIIQTLPNGVRVVVLERMFSTQLCKANPSTLFVFGDNLRRSGMGGQAIIRYEPNTYGIATKVAPDRRDISYFSDLVPAHREAILDDLKGLQHVLRTNPNRYTAVVFPAGGLGTGLSEMPTRAPRLFAEFNELLSEYFGVVQN